MQRIDQCRSCGAPILFIKSVAGKSIPVNAEQILYQQKAGGSLRIVTPNGEVLSGEPEKDPQKATGIGYISHRFLPLCGSVPKTAQERPKEQMTLKNGTAFDSERLHPFVVGI